jgi:hypothetical protein
MQLRQVLQVALAATSLACGDPTSITQEQFTIRATGREVRLSNAAEMPTFYFVVERETAAVIDFAPCVEGPECPSVAPGATVRIPYSGISGYQAGRKEAIVFWWRSARTPAGLQPDSLRSTVAKL